MYAKDYLLLRNSGIRIIILASSSILFTLIFYALFTSSQVTSKSIPKLHTLAEAVTILVYLSLAFVGYGIKMIFTSESMRNNNSYFNYLAKILKINYYFKILIVMSILYGVFFGFLSQIFIYHVETISGDVRFPSFTLTICCNLPGYVPMITIQMSNNFSILLVPINVILATVVSTLVGLNTAINVYALRIFMNKSRRNLSAVSTVGALTGLFVGCPTCAGSIFSSVLGFGTGTAIFVLASYQTVFILFSIPILVMTPFLMVRKIMRDQICNL